MRRFLITGAVALAICGVLFLAGASFAANTFTVKVLQRGNPVQGVTVEVIAADGQTTYVTNQSGTVDAQIGGNMFRLKVNNELFPGVHSVNEHQITVNLN